MAINPSLKAGLNKEAQRIEEDALFSSKGHYNACGPWQSWHRILGIASAIASALAAGFAAQKDSFPVLVVALSVLAAAMTAVITFLKPNEEADRHRRAADRYLAIKNRARIFRTVEMETQTREEEKLVETLKSISADLDAARGSAPTIPEAAYLKARQAIEVAGEADHRVDRK